MKLKQSKKIKKKKSIKYDSNKKKDKNIRTRTIKSLRSTNDDNPNYPNKHDGRTKKLR